MTVQRIASFLFVLMIPQFSIAADGLIPLGRGAVVAYPQTGLGIASWTPEDPSKLVVFNKDGGRASELSVPDSAGAIQSISVSPTWTITAFSDTGSIIEWSKGNSYKAEVKKVESNTGTLAGQISEQVLYALNEGQIVFLDGSTSKQLGAVRFAGSLQHVVSGKTSVLVLSSTEAILLAIDSFKPVFEPVAIQESYGKAVVSQENRLVAIDNGDRVEVFDLQERKHEYVDGQGVDDLCFAGRNNRLLVVGRDYEHRYKTDIWDLGTSLSDFSYKRSIDDRNGGAITGIPGTDDIVYFSTQKISGKACLARSSLQEGNRQEMDAMPFLKNADGGPLLYAIAASSNGSFVLASSGDGTASIWKLADTVKQLVTVGSRTKTREQRVAEEALVVGEHQFESVVQEVETLPNEIGAVLTAKDNTRYFLSFTGYPMVRQKVFDFLRETPTGLGDGGADIRFADLSKDGRYLAATISTGISVVDLAEPQEKHFAAGSYLSGWFSNADDQLLVVGSSGTKKIAIERGLESGETAWSEGERLGEDERVIAGVIFQGGIHAVLGAKTGNIISQLKVDYLSGRTKSCVSADGLLCAIAGGIRDGRGEGVQVFDVVSARSTASVPLDLAFSMVDVAFLNGNRELAICDTMGVTIFDYRRKRVVRRFPEKAAETLVDDAPSPFLTDVLGQPARINAGSLGFLPRSNVVAMGVHPKLNIVAIGGHDFVAVYASDSGKRLWHASTSAAVVGIQLASDKKLLVYGLESGRMIAVDMSEIY